MARLSSYTVAKYAPHSNSDKQQVSSWYLILVGARHLGNDIVIVVFKMIKVPFFHRHWTSQQNHVVLVVVPFEDSYKWSFYQRMVSHPYTRAPLRSSHCSKDAVGHDFSSQALSMVKELYKAPSFAAKISRTRTVLLLKRQISIEQIFEWNEQLQCQSEM
jgi:hypothetical protein